MQDDPTEEFQEPVEVPHTALSAAALQGVLENFVLREGTEYGERDFTLEQKVAQVLAQLERGDARVMFDPETQSVTIVLSDQS
ncbi:MAG: YheU family protein [Pseudomonadota bacterium]